MPTQSSVLISDFDGTMTSRDFYSLVCEQVLTPDTPDYWGQYEAGEVTHFEALRNIFGAVPAGEDAFLQLAQQTGIDPEIPAEVKALQQVGWDVMVVSAGCAWYIQKLLQQHGVDIAVHASPGQIVDGHLVMELPTQSDYFSAETGIDKAAAVKAALARGARVAYAGDGPVDLKPALLVPPHFRFARDSLAKLLRDRGEDFRSFDRWSDISRALRAEPEA
jgi:2-hydroxy-3-keto-5-methylthiopentenyl-1-phosphate phosphatase